MQKKFLTYISIALLVSMPCFSQQSDANGGWGGVADIFDFPVGANAMAMGGAYVSIADDPFALYWNPAAMENIQQMSLGLYYTNLPAGTQYNYIAYTYPTIRLGTFGAGILRLSTGDIGIRPYEDSPVLSGTTSYGRTLFLFGYSITFMDWISAGTTLKFERVDLPNFGSNISESAFGADLGVLIKPPWDIPWLENVAVGFNIQNILQRSIKAIEVRDPTPRNFRFGIAKTHWFGESGNHVKAAIEIDKNFYSVQPDSINNFNSERMPAQYHFGVEYGYRSYGMLRAGFERKQNGGGEYSFKPTFGLGGKFSGIQLDYSYWSWDAAIDETSHRISVVFNIGKTREQKLAELNERELDRFREELQNQQKLERASAISTGLSSARSLFRQGDLDRANVAIYRVLVLDPAGADPDFAEVRLLAERINAAIEERRKQYEQDALQKSVEEQERKRLLQEIETAYNRALAYYQSEDYKQAMAECDHALEINPNRADIKDLREKAENDLKRKIFNLSEDAKRFTAQNRIMEAITKWNQALQLAQNYNPLVESHIQGELQRLESRLNYEDLQRRAIEYEEQKDWEKAAQTYKEALKYAPGNSALKKRYDEANARANAVTQKMTPEVDELYKKALQALYKKEIDQAIEYYQQALKIQPYNKTLLNALDVARQQKAQNASR